MIPRSPVQLRSLEVSPVSSGDRWFLFVNGRWPTSGVDYSLWAVVISNKSTSIPVRFGFVADGIVLTSFRISFRTHGVLTGDPRAKRYVYFWLLKRP